MTYSPIKPGLKKGKRQSPKAYNRRYITVMEDLSEISQMMPRAKYMYKLMDTTIFQDFETALSVTIEDYYAENDNERECRG